MNFLIAIASLIFAALVSAWAARKIKYWLNGKGLKGGHATFVASAVSMSIPLLILLFGNLLIPTDLTVWPAIISAGIAIWTARRQKDGVHPAVQRLEMLARFGIID